MCAGCHSVHSYCRFTNICFHPPVSIKHNHALSNEWIYPPLHPTPGVYRVSGNSHTLGEVSNSKAGSMPTWHSWTLHSHYFNLTQLQEMSWQYCVDAWEWVRHAHKTDIPGRCTHTISIGPNYKRCHDKTVWASWQWVTYAHKDYLLNRSGVVLVYHRLVSK